MHVSIYCWDFYLGIDKLFVITWWWWHYVWLFMFDGYCLMCRNNDLSQFWPNRQGLCVFFGKIEESFGQNGEVRGGQSVCFELQYISVFDCCQFCRRNGSRNAKGIWKQRVHCAIYMIKWTGCSFELHSSMCCCQVVLKTELPIFDICDLKF